MKSNTRIGTTRRQFLKTSAVAGAGLVLPWKPTLRSALAAPLPASPLDATTVDPNVKFRSPLPIPGVMPQTVARGPADAGGPFDYYEIGVTQFTQQILPQSYPRTTVWGYGSVNHAGTLSYPAFTVEARVGVPVRVKWINALVDSNGGALRHLFSDQFSGNPPIPALAGVGGPVPVQPHLHGGHTDQESDGYPEGWFEPVGYGGTFPCAGPNCYDWNHFQEEFFQKYGVRWAPGTATYQYRNDQPAANLWYHDHTFNITAINVYAGMSGLYLLRGGKWDLPDGVLPGPAHGAATPHKQRPYEIPLVIQERKFNTDGSLRYDFGSGDIWVVNGCAWPYLEVEPRRYRFRILNGSNGSSQSLGFSDTSLPFWQIGVDGGFLRSGPQQLASISLAPAERADVIVDFADYQPGTVLYLQNYGENVLELRMVGLTSADRSVPPDQLVLPSIPRVGDPVNPPRQVGVFFPLLGTNHGIPWEDPVTETPHVNTVEQWNISAPGHPIHLHQVHFDILNAASYEDGPKDTVYGVRSIKALFDIKGRYVWHCHILEHEDMGMMRPIQVV